MPQKEKHNFDQEPEDLIQKPEYNNQIIYHSSEDRPSKIQIHLKHKEVKEFKIWCLDRNLNMSNAFRLMFKNFKNKI